MTIKVVTDSASDLAGDLVAAHSITVVPLDVRLGARSAREMADVAPEQFWQLATTETALAETSAPSPGAFLEAFRKAAADGSSAVVCVTISSRLSATFEAAQAAAGEAAAEIPVTVVDSRFATMGEGFAVLAAAETAEAGGGLGEVLDAVHQAIARISVYGTLDTLDSLRRGGRIGTAQALIGSLLSIKPVIEVRDGVVEGESRQRTRARSLAYLVDKVREAGPLRQIAVVHAAAPDIDAFVEAVDAVPHELPTLVGHIGPVIGAHTGPGTIGVCLHRMAPTSVA